jgi:hypothetical protein
MVKYQFIDALCKINALFPLAMLLFDFLDGFLIAPLLIFLYVLDAVLWFYTPRFFKRFSSEAMFSICILLSMVRGGEVVALAFGSSSGDIPILRQIFGVCFFTYIFSLLLICVVIWFSESYKYSPESLVEQEDVDASSQIIRNIANNNINALNLRIAHDFNGAINLWRKSLVDLESAWKFTMNNPSLINRINFEIENIKKSIQHTEKDLEDCINPDFKETSKFFRKLDIKKKKAFSEELESNFRGALRIWNRSLASLEQKSSDRITFRISERIMDEIKYIRTKIDINTDEKSKLPKKKFRKDSH